MSFDLNAGGTSTAVSFTASGTVSDDLSALSQAINKDSAKHGVSASIENNELILSNDKGEDITIENLDVVDNASAQVAGAGLTLNGLDYKGNASNPAVTASVTSDGDNAARVMGSLQFNSSESFKIEASAATMATAANTAYTSEVVSIDEVDIGTQSGSQDALAIIDNAIANIDAQRADLGAIQNRFDHTISNLANISENVSASRSRIQDTDFATETAEMTKNQILQQAGTSILSQANQLPQTALSLLG
ncbi:hypothetical protein MTF68_12545 [Pseudoalteromonas sp. 2CM37A]|nr:hypothetical protein [Pseudoalteromonas sp. 2CM37A]